MVVVTRGRQGARFNSYPLGYESPAFASAADAIREVAYHPTHRPTSRIYRCGHFPGEGGCPVEELPTLLDALRTRGVPYILLG